MAARTGYEPSLISWNLTRMCNLRCPHCYLDGGRKANNELATPECLAVIDEMKSLSTEVLILTGGEQLRVDLGQPAQRAAPAG